MEEPTTLKIRCFFDAKDPDGIPWITLEIPSPHTINLPVNAELGFELAAGTTTEKAVEIVNLLNEYVECPLIAYTDLDGSFCKDLDETLSRHVEHSLERR